MYILFFVKKIKKFMAHDKKKKTISEDERVRILGKLNLTKKTGLPPNHVVFTGHPRRNHRHLLNKVSH
jgi:hypothetical protein